nr:afamin-like [Loxodonta africana]
MEILQMITVFSVDCCSTIITFAQYVQKATFEEAEMLVEEMMEIRNKCLADRTLPNCAELTNCGSIIRILWEIAAKQTTLPDCYGHTEEKFNETTEKSLKMVQQECERFQNLGKDDLKYQYFVELVKLKPQRTEEELRSLLTDFINVVEKCCKAEGPEACFTKEGLILEAKSQAAPEA